MIKAMKWLVCCAALVWTVNVQAGEHCPPTKDCPVTSNCPDQKQECPPCKEC